MEIEFSITDIEGLYSYVTDTEWSACYLPELTDEEKKQQRITLSQSLSKPASIYLFALSTPELDNQFITDIYTFLNSNGGYSIREKDHCFIWLNQQGNPDVATSYKFAQTIIFDSSFSIKKTGTNYQKLWFNNASYFAVPAYSEVSINPEKDGFLIRRQRISTPYDYGLYLTNLLTGTKTAPLGKITKNNNDPESEPPLLISLSGIGGAIQFDLSFPFQFEDPLYYEMGKDRYPYDEEDLCTILPVGLKFYYRNEDFVEITYPLFNNLKPLEFSGAFHPGAILNPAYTYFAFKTPSALYTNLSTSYGQPINIESTAGARLVFSKSPDSPDDPRHPGIHQSRYYWTLAGDFTLLNVSSKEEQLAQNRILCGISGTETINFAGKTAKQDGDLICFKPGQPALANDFPLLNASSFTAGGLLSAAFTTAWVAFKKRSNDDNSAISYYSQPEGAPLFSPVKTSGILDYTEVPATDLGLHTFFFPLAPSAITKPILGSRVKGNPGYYTQETIAEFEIQLLNPARKQAIAAAKSVIKRNKGKLKAKTTSAASLSTTPQGLLVSLTDNQSAWQSLTLANPNLNAAGQSSSKPLLFDQIANHGADTGLQEAFQTNEQFLVISNPIPAHSDYYDTYFQNKIDVAAWPFILDITGRNKWTGKTGFNNIVIFKFCNYSIEERIRNQQLWTDPLNFNSADRLPALSSWVTEYIDKAKEAVRKDGDKSPFRNFVDIVTNPAWNGILCLQVTVDLTSLPKEIKAILAGIDTTRFTAHHFGIEANHIGLTEENKLDTNFKSSMFGLINYFNKDYEVAQTMAPGQDKVLPAAPGDFDFKVLELQVLFDKSVIKDFKSRIQLSFNSLFNERVTAESTASAAAINRYSIIMDGLYDNRNGNTAYSFSVKNRNILTLDSVALKNADLVSVQLATVNQTDAAVLTTRFYISGLLQFAELENFDMFSYNGLPFSNLILDMKFDLNKLDADHTPKKLFSFQPAGIVFNKTNIDCRGESLASHFPLELNDLLYHSNAGGATDKAVTPSSLAYLAVDAPLSTSNISNTWYALRFNINLGSMGALTAKVGFTAEILLAWSPQSANNQAQVFIKMPFSGATANKSFSLQGILKFAVGSILFVNTPAGDGSKPQYAMVFSQIGLSLLGLKLPRSGNTAFYLFGNPDGNTAATADGNLGWFGAYKKEEDKPKNLKQHN